MHRQLLAAAACIRVESTMPATSTAPVIRTGPTSVLWASGRVGRSLRRGWRTASWALRTSTSTSTTAAAAEATTHSSGTHGILVLIVHTLPGSSAVAVELLVRRAAALHRLTLVLLLLETELLLGIEPGSWLRWLVHWRTSLASAHSSLLHGSHLLHHGWIHPLTLHHLLHHRVVHHGHLIHAATHVVRRHLLLHHLEVLLHLLPVRSHHGRSHLVTATIGIRSHLLLSAILAVLVLLSLPAKLTTPSVVLLTHVAAWLGSLDLDWLAADSKRTLKSAVDSCLAVERDESEPTGASGLLVHHQSCIENIAKVPEEVGEFFLAGILTNATHEDLGSALLLIARNGALRVDLFTLVRF